MTKKKMTKKKTINEELNKIVNEENEKLMIKIKNGVTELINKHGIKYINLKTEDLEKKWIKIKY